MENTNMELLRAQKADPDYQTALREITSLLEDLPEPMRRPMFDAMVKFILFQG